MAGRFKRILANEYETESHKLLEVVAQQYGARVFAKVRVADVLDIERSGLPQREYSYSLRSHFDFVVTQSDSQAAFAVEFDGRSHDVDPNVVYRDSLKNAICERFEMPLLRIDSGFMRRIGRFTLLGYLAEVWFLREAFLAAQQRGEVAYDEDFHPGFVLAGGIDTETMRFVDPFPYDLAFGPRQAVARLIQEGVCKQTNDDPFLLQATDPAGYAVALQFFTVKDGTIIGVGRCRLYRFPPLTPLELAYDLAWVNAAEKLERYRRGALEPASRDHVRAWRDRIAAWRNYT